MDAKATERWLREYLEANDKTSIHDVVRDALKANVPCTPDQVAGIRLRIRGDRSQAILLAESVAMVTNQAPAVQPKCARCGGEHWAGQCMRALYDATKVLISEVNEAEATLAEAKARENAEREKAEERKRAKDLQKAEDEARAARVVATPPRAQDPESRRKTVAGMMIRRQRLNELLDADPGADPSWLMGTIRKEFGIGLGVEYLYDTCKVAREIHRLPQISEKEGGHERDDRNGREALPTFGAPAAEPEPKEEEPAATVDEELAWLAKQCADVMRLHGLTELSMDVASGKARWKYSISRKAEGSFDV